MQRVMAAEAEATRDARAKVKNWKNFLQNVQVIHSEGERKAAKALTEAALLLEQNDACLPLRYLQVGLFACWWFVEMIMVADVI